MSLCPCGSGKDLAACCAPLHEGAPAPSPEALMRARYTAFTLGNIDFLERSLAPESRSDFDRAGAESWSRDAEWQSLEVRSTEGGAPGESEGLVEFVARFRLGGKDHVHHETGQFRRDGDTWLYVDGTMGPRTIRRGPKVGRNDPCPCGSGRKYKQCCGKAA